jgi:hypothetical protein
MRDDECHRVMVMGIAIKSGDKKLSTFASWVRRLRVYDDPIVFCSA